MRSSCLRILLASLLVISPVTNQRAFAWGDNGHIAVARVADKYLTANARQKISQILGGRKIYDRSICMFADTYKHTPAGKHTRSWHYVDIPLTSTAYNASRDCMNKDCVVAQIVEQ